MTTCDRNVVPKTMTTIGIKAIRGTALNATRKGRSTALQKDRLPRISPTATPSTTPMTRPATDAPTVFQRYGQIELGPELVNSEYSRVAMSDGELMKNRLNRFDRLASACTLGKNCQAASASRIRNSWLASTLAEGGTAKPGRVSPRRLIGTPS